MFAIRHSNDSFEDRSRSADIWAFFSRRRGRKLDFCPVSAVVKSASGSVVLQLEPVLMKVRPLNSVCGGVVGHVGLGDLL